MSEPIPNGEPDRAEELDEQKPDAIVDNQDPISTSPESDDAKIYSSIISATLNNESASNQDTLSQVCDRIGRVANSETLRKETLKRERSEGNLRHRLAQNLLHTALADARVQALEESLSKLHNDFYGKPILPKYDDSKREKHHVFKHVLRRSTPSEFSLNSNSKNIPILDRPVLEIMVAEHTQKENSDDFSEPTISKTGSKTDSSVSSPVERLRVRSVPLLQHLGRVTSAQLELYHNLTADDRTDEPAIVFLRPFKLFVTHENVIRQSLVELETAAKQEAVENKGKETAPAKKMPWQDGTFQLQHLIKELKLLMEFMDVDMSPTFELRRQIRDGTATEIEYPDLWHLFKRGDVVISQSNRSHAYRAINFAGGREPLVTRLRQYVGGDDDAVAAPVDGFTVDCISLLYDGSHYVPNLETFSIRPYLGRRKIASLPVYPLHFDAEADKLGRSFMDQGRLFKELTIPPFVHKMLTGKTLDEPSINVNAPVIVDMAIAMYDNPELVPEGKVSEDDLTENDLRETEMPTFCAHRMREGCCGADIIYKDFQIDELARSEYLRDKAFVLKYRNAEELTGDDLMLLPHWVHGFVLRSRSWVKLRMGDLSEIRFENSFDSLLLPQKHKHTIQAMVKTHEDGRGGRPNTQVSVRSTVDIIEGKGEGLIVLLHGQPGVGKTSTAECVADETKRPLFSITCGDIGESALEVERNLQSNFILAHKWGCVLLLDEADVFLARRNKTDLRRNAVVSVFLRTLEYYAGVLFLTTNRVGGIDPAFKSRIHLSLYYPPFDLESTLSLYKVFIDRITVAQKQNNFSLFKIKEKEILRFAKRHFKQLKKAGFQTWNGRQIRNAFQAAIALAEYEHQRADASQPLPTLGKAQFEVMAESSREFEEYLRVVLKSDESEMAKREEWRADEFTGKGTMHAAAASSNSRPAYQRTRGAVRGPPAGPAINIKSDTDSDESSESSDGD